ncbi:MAG: TetR/AcrR family transcriptional regulator [Lachnospiraceae bacterium]
MPKVTDDYLTDKRNFILECTNEILKEKPLYQITMRNIIKKAGFSQGAIYRYYSNLDEIYIDLINKSTTDNFLEQKIDALLSSEQPEKMILSECIMAIGDYVEELLKSVGGKTCFELLVFYAYDNKKRNTVFPQLKFKQSLEYAQNKLVDYTISNIQKGILRPTISMNAIIMFICVSIDGIAQTVSMSAIGDNDKDKRLKLDISEMFETLAKAIINFLR